MTHAPTPTNHLAITTLLTTLAYAEDTLDWQLFQTSWTQLQLLNINLSSHLAQYDPDLQISAAQLARTAHEQLSGFDGTQHVLSNFFVRVDDTGDRAVARAYVTAYHALKRIEDGVDTGPGFVLVRGVWKVSCAREDEGWKATGIVVERMVAAQGDEALYDVARRRGESGVGRKALTLWTE